MSKNFELLTQIEREFSTPAAAPIPEAASPSLAAVPSLSHPAPAVDQEMTRLVQRVFFSTALPVRRHAVFCGIEATNASSAIVARAARALAAKADEKVCLIDANPAQGGVSGVLGIPLQPDGGENGSLAASCVPIGPKLSLLRWPAANGHTLPPSELRSAVSQLRSEFGYLLIDVPGCLSNDEAIAWARIADATVLVVEADASRRDAANEAKQKLVLAGARLAGTVLNNLSYPVPKALYERL